MLNVSRHYKAKKLIILLFVIDLSPWIDSRLYSEHTTSRIDYRKHHKRDKFAVQSSISKSRIDDDTFHECIPCNEFFDYVLRFKINDCHRDSFIF